MYKVTNLSRSVDIFTDTETHRLAHKESVVLPVLTTQVQNLQALKVVKVTEVRESKPVAGSDSED
ncbi:hypothetical protein LIS04_68 [Listeria phage LIS04]|nr:hypothetical protein LIS04_68 [Listeria phage LIS04]